ncbi:MAG: Rab family GTPase [Candidatus Heimdallarchaeaceae archaeon]
MSLEPKRAYKIVLIGDPEVGKTSIRRRYMGKTFKGEYLKTIGADFAAQKVVVEGETVLLTIWDLAGQSIFHGMRSSFYQGCKSALVVFDVTNPATLENVEKWVEEAVSYAKNSLQEIYIIGNKIDLEKERVVQWGDIEKKAEKIREITNFPVRIYETSALTGENIQDLFKNLSRRLIIGDNIAIEGSSEVKSVKTDVKAGTEEANRAFKDLKISSEISDLVNEIEFHMQKINKLVAKLKKRIKSK